MDKLKKVSAVVVIIIIHILLFGIIPLNILLIWKDFPQWIMILASVVDMSVVLLIAKKAFSGKAAKIIAITKCLGSYVCTSCICLSVLE